MNLGLKDKVAFVTGGGRNIGRQIALTFAHEGAKVVVNDFFIDRAETVAAEIKTAGGDAIGVRADVTNRQEIDACINEALKTFGRIDILVNNAGVPRHATGADIATAPRFVDTNRENWDMFLELNLYGALNCTNAVLEGMIQRKYGKIINITSDAGRTGEPRLVAYSAAKSSLIGFTKALAKEVGKYSINVNCIGVGITPHEGATTDFPQEMKKIMLKQYPMGKGLDRLGLPSDIANAVAFFSSDASVWVTGQVLSVSGGFTM